MDSTEKVTAVINIPSADEERKLSTQVSDIEFRAESIIINDDESYNQAADFVREVKRMLKSVKDFFKPMKDQAHKAHAEICKRENEMTEPLANAEKILKASMGEFAAVQERKRREEAERARLEAKMIAKTKLEEAIAADEAGDEDAREMAVNPAPLMSEPVKAKGITQKKDWEIVSIDEDKVPVDINGMVIRPVDKAAIMKLIKASKGKVKIDGVTYREKLIGGWYRVFRKRNGEKEETYKEVGLEEYDKKQANWKTKPCTMIEKVAVSQALRAAFPRDFEGLYTAEEVSPVQTIENANGSVEIIDCQTSANEKVSTITQEQRQQLFSLVQNALGKERGNELIKEVISSYGLSSTSKMTPEIYEQVIADVKQAIDVMDSDN